MYHCTADLLFILFRFSCFAHDKLASALPVKQEVSCKVILPLKSVFSNQRLIYLMVIVLNITSMLQRIPYYALSIRNGKHIYLRILQYCAYYIKVFVWSFQLLGRNLPT